MRCKTLRVKCPDTEFFLVRIFLHLDQRKLRIWTLFRKERKIEFSLREKCPNAELFLVRILPYSDFVSLRIQSECGKIRTRENSVFGNFSRSES